MSGIISGRSARPKSRQQCGESQQLRKVVFFFCQAQMADVAQNRFPQIAPFHAKRAALPGSLLLRTAVKNLSFWDDSREMVFSRTDVRLRYAGLLCRRQKFIQYRTGAWKCHRHLLLNLSPTSWQNFWTHRCTIVFQYWAGFGTLIGESLFLPLPALDKDQFQIPTYF